MGPIGLDVIARPGEAVAALDQAVRPEIRAPAEPRSLELADHAILDHASYRIAAVVGSGLRVEPGDRVTAVGAAREVDEMEVRVADAHGAGNRSEVRLERSRIPGEAPVLTGDCLLQPDRLHLVRRDAGCDQSLIDAVPVGGVGLDTGRVPAVLCAVDDRQVRVLRWV